MHQTLLVCIAMGNGETILKWKMWALGGVWRLVRRHSCDVENTSEKGDRAASYKCIRTS